MEQEGRNNGDVENLSYSFVEICDEKREKGIKLCLQ